MHWRKITIVGVGLLGGSLGLAIKHRKLADMVAGHVRRKASVTECLNLGVVDQATMDFAEAADSSDLVVLCTPLAQMAELTRRMLPALKRGAVVTDVGSVKGTVVQELEPLVAQAGAHFVGSHPMAGAERIGVKAAHAELFDKAVCVLTPTPRSKPEAVSQVEALWHGVGARTLSLSPALHDELVSRSSHLPHVIAAELVNFVLNPGHPSEQPLLCANGFRDTTRIASGSPEMWRDIALANAENLGQSLDAFIKGLQTLRSALRKNDARAIEQFFIQARQRRDQWSGQSNSPE